MNYRGKIALATTLAICSLGAGSASAAEVRMQALMGVDGNGTLLANNGSDPFSWERCDPGPSNCTPFAVGRHISTNGAPAESVFRVTSGADTGVSPLWHGDASALATPTVTGNVRANELVTPHAGQWAGGWEGAQHELQLAACFAANGTNCIALTPSQWVGGSCAYSGAILHPEFTGMYLRVADQNLGAGPIVRTLQPIGPPYGLPVWQPSQSTSWAVVGKIAPATGSRTVPCEAKPLPSTMITGAKISTHGAVDASCWRGCQVIVTAKRGRRTVRIRQTVRTAYDLNGGLYSKPLARSVQRMRFSRRAVKRLGSGRVRITVKLDGKVAAKRSVRFGK